MSENDYWLARWREGRIGFHEGAPNSLLERHIARLGHAHRVLVPLCGKTEDLAFLASRGFDVVGVELSEEAVLAFIEEHQLSAARTTRGPFTAYVAGRLTLLVGDFFATTPELTDHCDAYYDRAALIALPPELRARYVPHVRTLVAPGSPGLVIAFEHGDASGPPYSVAESEVRALYGAVEPLQRRTEDRKGAVATETLYAVTV